MVVEQFLQNCNILLRLVDRSWWDGMTGHRNRQFVPNCVLEPKTQIIVQGHANVHLRHRGRSSSTCQPHRQI